MSLIKVFVEKFVMMKLSFVSFVAFAAQLPILSHPLQVHVLRLNIIGLSKFAQRSIDRMNLGKFVYFIHSVIILSLQKKRTME